MRPCSWGSAPAETPLSAQQGPSWAFLGLPASPELCGPGQHRFSLLYASGAGCSPGAGRRGGGCHGKGQLAVTGVSLPTAGSPRVGPRECPSQNSAAISGRSVLYRRDTSMPSVTLTASHPGLSLFCPECDFFPRSDRT